MKIIINNYGCDDYTEFEMVVNDSELEVIKRFVELNNQNSEYGCQPKIEIEVIA